MTIQNETLHETFIAAHEGAFGIRANGCALMAIAAFDGMKTVETNFKLAGDDRCENFLAHAFYFACQSADIDWRYLHNELPDN